MNSETDKASRASS